jgi:hypothetical protein
MRDEPIGEGPHSADDDAERDPGSPAEPVRALSRLASASIAGVVVAIAVGAALHESVDELSFLVVGVQCLALACIIWRYPTIASQVDESVGSPAVSVRRAFAAMMTWRWSRPVLTPILLAGGVMLLVAGTPTGIGHALHWPAHAAVATWNYVYASWQLLVCIWSWLVVLGALVVGAVRREHRVACLVGLVALPLFAALANYVFYSYYRELFLSEWTEVLAPLRSLIDWF